MAPAQTPPGLTDGCQISTFDVSTFDFRFSTFDFVSVGGLKQK
jgi:hypothetical protein